MTDNIQSKYMKIMIKSNALHKTMNKMNGYDVSVFGLKYSSSFANMTILPGIISVEENINIKQKLL